MDTESGQKLDTKRDCRPTNPNSLGFGGRSMVEVDVRKVTGRKLSSFMQTWPPGTLLSSSFLQP